MHRHHHHIMAENLSDEKEVLASYYFSLVLYSLASVDSATDPDSNTIQQWYPVRRTRRQRFLTATMTGPVAIRDWNSALRIPFDSLVPFQLQDRSYSWCLGMRFARREIAEVLIILKIPDDFDNGQSWQHHTSTCGRRSRSGSERFAVLVTNRSCH